MKSIRLPKVYIRKYKTYFGIICCSEMVKINSLEEYLYWWIRDHYEEVTLRDKPEYNFDSNRVKIYYENTPPQPRQNDSLP